jgi:hypothetical protein
MDVGSIEVRTRQGRERTLDDLTTLFDLCLVVIDVRRPSCTSGCSRSSSTSTPS